MEEKASHHKIYPRCRIKLTFYLRFDARSNTMYAGNQMSEGIRPRRDGCFPVFSPCPVTTTILIFYSTVIPKSSPTNTAAFSPIIMAVQAVFAATLAGTIDRS